jgi:lon-related putative ATP-dependent protease
MDQAIGQERAMEAIAFGVNIQQPGYNLFALGPTGTGKHFVIRQYFDQAAAERPAPSDWCYVHNFQSPRQPRPLELPAGRGAKLRDHMERLMEDVRAAIGSAFDSDEYRSQRRIIEELLKERQQQAIETLKADAEAEDVAILTTGSGFALAPMDEDGELMERDAFKALERDERQEIEETMATYQERLEEALRQAPLWEQEQRQKLRELDKEVSAKAVSSLFKAARRRYKGLEEVLDFLTQVKEDVLERAAELVNLGVDEDEAHEVRHMSQRDDEPDVSRRYQVNLVIDNSQTQGAPVIYEDLPTVYNLLGRIEHRVHMGAAQTDFTLIRPGAMHLANGGYLVLDASLLLQQPHAWSQLKRTLRSAQIRTGSIEQLLDRVSSVSLEPLPIPLDIKVVLVGERGLYYTMAYEDPDFAQLFKVAADFDEDMRRTPENEGLFARLVATLARKHGLMALDREAVAAVIDQAARAAEDNDKLSIRIQNTSDLLREADYHARADKQEVITADAVRQATSARHRRAGRVRERAAEDIRRGVVLIDTEGQQIGQINGLAVMHLGPEAFGRPFRITASWRMGSGDVIDIEREADLGGPLHSKGVMIITGFLGWRYARSRQLPINASIVMEQSYGEVDGDSASLAELCALLSALSGVPIRQSVALTGSVNQYGHVQAIGGVNEKIEGFFDICQARGLTGDQGVLIPASNVPHLMLREDVAQACAQGQFHVWAVQTVDEALGLLTDTDIGQPDEKGAYPAGSLHRHVEDLLEMLSQAS